MPGKSLKDAVLKRQCLVGVQARTNIAKYLLLLKRRVLASKRLHMYVRIVHRLHTYIHTYCTSGIFCVESRSF